MLQNLLTEQFHLTLHHEPKVLSVYILSVAAGGPKLKPSPAGRECASGAAYQRVWRGKSLPDAGAR